jgi:nucleotide-binding universal stress UspA family protein
MEPAVVVGVDGSDQSGDALALALTLVEPLGASLSPVSVHPYGPLAGTLPESRYEEFVTELADAVHEHMRSLGLPVAERRLRLVSARSPAAGLQRMAEEEPAAVIVVGGSSRSRLGRVFPGGTAERLLAGAPCPVAIAPRGYARDRDGIVFVGAAFDGSLEACGALDWAANLARAIPAQLRLLSVNQPLPPATVPAAAGLPLASINEELREELARQLTEAEAAVRGDGLEVAGALLDGDAAAELAKATVHLDLLVLGSRGYGPLGAVMLGSVSNTLVGTASCPVVVVPRSVNARRRAEHRMGPARAS